MQNTTRIGALLVAFFGGSVSACGPAAETVTAVRMMYAPGNPDACPIEVVNVNPALLGPMNTDYDLLGNLAVRSSTATNPDPFNPERLALIRPKACSLGGDSVALAQEAGGLTLYAVMRKKGGGGATPTPSESSSPAATP
jgi:hypothetical protein